MTQIPLDHIRPDPNQPRKHFDEENIQELADSILLNGLIQPITVRLDPQSNTDGADHYLIVAGERRYRAHKLLGWPTIEAAVVESTNRAGLAAIQIVENLQRENLSTAELVQGISELVKMPGNTGSPLGVGGVAAMLGKSKTWVSRRAKIARMAEPIRQLVADGLITDVDAADALDALHAEFKSLALNAIKQIRGEQVQHDWKAPYTLDRAGFRECLQRARERAKAAEEEHARNAADPDYVLVGERWEHRPQQSNKSQAEQDSDRARRQANEQLRPLREQMNATLRQIRQQLRMPADEHSYCALTTGQLFSTDFVPHGNSAKPVPDWDALTRNFRASVTTTEQLARLIGALAHVGVTAPGWQVDGFKELELSGQQLDTIVEWLKAHPTGRLAIDGEPAVAVAQAQPDVCMTLDEAIGTFIAERCDLGPSHSTRIADAYDAWLDWCQATGNRACDQPEFSRQIQAGDVTKKRREDAHYFIGLALLGDEALGNARHEGGDQNGTRSV